jgi:hypothetical protein
MTEPGVTLYLTHDQALVLFEYLAREDEGEGLPRVHQAERNVLWVLEGQLESALPEILLPGYTEAITAARERLVAED